MTRRRRRLTPIACIAAVCLAASLRAAPGLALSPTFEPFEPAPEPDLVRLVQAQVESDTVTVDIRIGGPTTSRAYHTFVFEILIEDPTLVEFVEGSGRSGSFLAPPVSVLASGAGDRVVVGVSTLSTEGRGTDHVEATVLSLTFRALTEGATRLSFTGRYGLVDGPVALDVNGLVIPTARFGTGGLLTVSPERLIPVSGPAP